jgi:hypothetical protein
LKPFFLPELTQTNLDDSLSAPSSISIPAIAFILLCYSMLRSRFGNEKFETIRNIANAQTA